MIWPLWTEYSGSDIHDLQWRNKKCNLALAWFSLSVCFSSVFSSFFFLSFLGICTLGALSQHARPLLPRTTMLQGQWGRDHIEIEGNVPEAPWVFSHEPQDLWMSEPHTPAFELLQWSRDKLILPSLAQIKIHDQNKWSCFKSLSSGVLSCTVVDKWNTHGNLQVEVSSVSFCFYIWPILFTTSGFSCYLSPFHIDKDIFLFLCFLVHFSRIVGEEKIIMWSQIATLNRNLWFSFRLTYHAIP